MNITSKRYQGVTASGKAPAAMGCPFGQQTSALRSGGSGDTKRRSVKRRSRRAKK